jgi:hypothetical protein
MPTDLTVVLGNRPGTLAQLSETLGRAGINIEGACGYPREGEGLIHLLIEDAAAARKALQDAGMIVGEERPVLVVPVQDRPGELGKLARRIADAGVNVDLLYLSRKGEVVLGVDNLDKARQAV